MSSWWDKIKGGLFALAQEVYHWLLSKINRQKLELRNKDLEKEIQQNEHESSLDTRSDNDVIRDAINKRKRDRSEPE